MKIIEWDKSQAIPLADYYCGNCRTWERCKLENAWDGKPRTKQSRPCIGFYPVVIKGKEVIYR